MPAFEEGDELVFEAWPGRQAGPVRLASEFEPHCLGNPPLEKPAQLARPDPAKIDLDPPSPQGTIGPVRQIERALQRPDQHPFLFFPERAPDGLERLGLA